VSKHSCLRQKMPMPLVNRFTEVIEGRIHVLKHHLAWAAQCDDRISYRLASLTGAR
jgi:hypothetical protein